VLAIPGFVAGPLIAGYGWQSMFIVGGVLPCVIAVIAIGVLPESFSLPHHQGTGKKDDPPPSFPHRARRKTRRGDDVSFQGNLRHNPEFDISFRRGETALTLLLWVMFFMNLWICISSIAGCRASSATRHSLEHGSRVTSLLQIGGTCGALLLGRLMDRLLSFRVLAATYIAAGISIFFIGQAGSSVLFLAFSVFAAGFFVIGDRRVSNALAAEFYPTAIRATGVGWALGIGRVGSIIGPTLGPMLMTPGIDSRHVFWAASLPPIVAMIAAFSASVVEPSSDPTSVVTSHADRPVFYFFG
jgi:AAHS family 4-hydroxybenzoate transporter-like MFS transporter